MNFLIKEQTVKKLFEYLGRKPYFEVESLVSELKQLTGVVEKVEKNEEPIPEAKIVKNLKKNAKKEGKE